MDLFITNVNLSGHGIETPTQEIYQRYPCPICGSDKSLEIIAEVCAGNDTSIESAMCIPCEHRFHHKFPRADWLQRYYREKFDNPANSPLEIIEGSVINKQGVYRRLRSRIGSLIRHGMAQTIPNRIHDFLLGLTKKDHNYYNKDPEIRRVLEIGCGNGSNLLYFKERGYETYGTEVNPIRLRECLTKGLQVYSTGIDNFEPIQSKAPFDFAYSSHVLEHVIDVDNHIQAIADMIRPDGYLYIETPDQSGESLIYQTHTIYHVQTFSLASMLRLLAKHGFKPVRIAVDGNIQLLAQKKINPAPLMISGRIFENVSLPYLKVISDNGPGEFKINWDHHRTKITDLKNKKVLYESGLSPLKVRHGPNQHELVCSVVNIDNKLSTVRFIHKNLSLPPIWYKI